MNSLKWIYLCFLTLAITFSSCSGSNGIHSAKKQVRCAKKSYKQKKYKLKKRKNAVRAYYPPPHSSTSLPSISKQVPQQTNTRDSIKQDAKNKPLLSTPKSQQIDTQTETSNRRESGELSIPDLKSNMPTQKEKVIEFRGEEIELTEENEFTFDEQVEFIDLSDLFTNRSKAIDQLDELTKLLRKDRSLHVTIIGNTATTTPKGNVMYGDENQVLDQMAILNADTVTIRDVMIARATRVHNLLLSNGVDASQLDVRTGSYRMWKKDRVVSFILRRKED